jgi:Condensation domain
VPGVGGGLSGIQRRLWNVRAAGLWTDPEARGLRMTGRVDDARLAAAVAEVIAAMPALRTGVAAQVDGPVITDRSPAVYQHVVDGSAAVRDQRCMALLAADRARMIDPIRDPLVRFHLVRCASDEMVLGLVADPLVLDVRSVYLVLGAVIQAYFGRFRVAQYPLVAESTPAAAPGSSRWRWWTRCLSEWHARGPMLAAALTGQHSDFSPDARRDSTAQLYLNGSRWARLTGVADHAGNTGTLAIVALVIWWLRHRTRRPAPAVFGSTLDLRELWGLGPVIGPLTDRIVFEVDLAGVAAMSFRDLVRRAHSGLLDTVVHYVGYHELAAIATAAALPPLHRFADIVVHYCRAPPASGHTRGEETLARLGLSIELFQESAFTRLSRPRGVHGESAAVQLHVAEQGAGMALVVNFAADRVAGAAVADLLADMDRLIDRVSAAPDTVLGEL